MIKAYKLFTGTDGHSHIAKGTVAEGHLTNVTAIHFKETPPHSSYDWHPAPTTQYVLSLSGTLLFETALGETFTLWPGEVLLAMDTFGSGHKWKLLDDQPWKRAYVVFENDIDIIFL